jgi:hypothetical protein
LRVIGIDAYQPQSWPQHLRTLNWRQGEHLLIAGPTSAGKTTLAAPLLDKRRHVVVLVTKVKDPAFKDLYRKRGYETIHEWPPPQWAEKVLLWPKPGKTLKDTLAVQRDVFRDALNAIGKEGNRCVCVDESHWITSREFLGLGPEIAILHHQGRTSGVSMVNLTQRPAWIPKIIYSSVTHAYVARTRDRDDLKNLSNLGGIDAKAVQESVAGLGDRHDYLYMNPQGDTPPAIINTRK